MKALITGGAGFVGSHLAEALLARGDEVHVLDNLSTGSIENIEHLKAEPRFHYAIDSVMNEPVIAELVDRVGRGLPPGRRGRRAADRREPGQHDRDQRARDRDGAEARQQEAQEGADRLDLGGLRQERTRCRSARTATWCWGRPPRAAGATPAARRSTSSWRSPTTRRSACRWWSRGCSTRSGPRQTGRYGMVIPNFVKQALLGHPITVFGDGTQTRCFTYVSDVVGALIALAEDDRAVGQVFNIGNDREEVTILDLARRVKAAHRRPQRDRARPLRPGLRGGLRGHAAPRARPRASCAP